jgi:hypothetical protein
VNVIPFSAVVDPYRFRSPATSIVASLMAPFCTPTPVTARYVRLSPGCHLPAGIVDAEPQAAPVPEKES